ncbi:DNA-dirted RNA polymerase [Dyella thiooxydans]|uniref:DNA-dirted RNA polymerase n=1 Tax=Dyella thiooxydans TaxID=445710 RepID=A0A160N152_9GAMM|nr:S9 family peptidase [Dyella thiooxydans]AND69008.1 DNA-dirted RNA polymerase [Dyella thiooxydans]
MIRRLSGLALLALLALPMAAPAAEKTPFTPADINRLAALSDPALSPDGRWLLYTVTTTNADTDQPQSDLWRVGFDGRGRTQLTHTPDADESQAEWSGDGKLIAFLTDRKTGTDKDDEDSGSQVWTMPADGGEAHQVTHLPAGVEEFALSPDGKRLAVIAFDPERPPGTKKPKNPPPIVTDRFQFKDDDSGWLGARHKHLYVVDIASGQTTELTPGKHDEQLPAWSPDSRQIAYVTKRGADPDRHLNYDIYVIDARAGARERQLTTFPGADLDPYWVSRPAWSPDGKRIAYLRSGEDKWIYYAPWQLAVIDVATGKSTIPAPIDRCFTHPTWAPDGRSVYALIEQAEVTHLARIDVPSGKVTELTHGDRFDVDLSVARDGRIAVLGGDDLHPYNISALDGGHLRLLADHNEWLAGKQLASTETLHFTGADGTPLDALLVKPIGYVKGKRYPTILRVHGGPVYQFSHEFMEDWQVYAANGFAVLAVNPRGSSGRGFDFAKAIYADWGDKDMQDLMAGVDHAIKLGVADPEHLGIGGWSYGAILTDEVIARTTRFKAAISGAGTGNMYGMYGDDEYAREYELELGTPWDHRAAWDRVSYPFLHADRITTPTLFQCGQIDFNVPCIGAEQMYQALRSRGVPTELVVYPGQHHEISVPSYLLDRMRRNLAWYERFLKPGDKAP